MKTKYLFMFILFWNISYGVSNAKDISKYNLDCDTITESGYFILIQEKAIVEKLIENKRLKKEGKVYTNYYSMAGFNCLFIPDDSIDDKNNKFQILLKNRLDFMSNSIYTLYHNLNQADFKSLRGLEGKFETGWPSFVGSSFYSLIGENNKYCFQLYKLSAKWVRFKFKSKDEVFDFIGREALYLNKSESCFEVYILKDVISSDNKISIENLPIKLWKSYLNENMKKGRLV